MNSYKELAKTVYQEVFASTYDESMWKFGYTQGKMDGKSIKEVTMGAGFEELFWYKTKTTRKKHIEIRFVETDEECRVFFKGTMTMKQKDRTIDIITQHIKETMALDTIVWFYHDSDSTVQYNLVKQKATGEKANRIMKLCEMIRKCSNTSYSNVLEGEFYLNHTSNMSHLEWNVKKGCVHLFVNNTCIETFYSEEEIKQWIKKEEALAIAIEKIKETTVQILKEKLQILNIKWQIHHLYIGKYPIPCGIIRKYRLGKPKIEFKIGDEKTSVTLDSLENKAKQCTINFANKYRLKMITGKVK